MARPTAYPWKATRSSEQGYTGSQSANMPYYAGHMGYSYTLGNTGTDAGIKSGVVRPGKYTGTPESGFTWENRNKWQSAINAPGQPYDMFGNPSKQPGGAHLARTLSGMFQFDPRSFMPRRTKKGAYIPNNMSMWLQSQGVGGTSFNFIKQRRTGVNQQSTGWRFTLTNAPVRIGDEKASSSIYQGFERYSTQETRLGTAYSTDPNAGYKALPGHAPDQHYMSGLGQMYKKENTQTGPARRYERKFM